MSESYCKKFEKCPIFQKDILFGERTGETYKKLYCTKGIEINKTCKRYIVSEILGKPVPEKVMPNSILSVEEIIEKIKNGYFDR